MSPRFSRLYIAHSSARNSVISSNTFVLPVIASDRADLVFSQFGADMCEAPRRYRTHFRGMLMGRCAAGPRNLVVRIIPVSSPAEVFRVHAWRVVARVKGDKPLGSRLAGKGKGYVRSQKRDGLVRDERIRNSPVPLAISGSYPVPAGTALFNLIPETGLKVSIKYGHKLVSHVADSLRCGQGRALLTQRFRPNVFNKIDVTTQAEAML